MGIAELFACLAVLVMFYAVAAAVARRGHRRKEMEHAERMKALEVGVVPLPSGLDWPAASVCIAIGAGVPIGSFVIAWLAALTGDAPNEIWFAPVFVSFAAVGAARKLAYRIIDPKADTRGCSSKKARASTHAKPAFDPEAFDVVGSRGNDRDGERMGRMRHYTRKSGKDKILVDRRIDAQDQNKVFVEYGDGDPYSPRDAEARYRLKRGKGNAYVEFEAEEGEIQRQINALTGRTEYFLRGDVDLTDRDPEGFDNI